MVANNDVDGEGRRSERRRAAIIRDGWMMGWGKARKKSSERGGETEVDGDPGRLYVHSTAQYSRCIHTGLVPGRRDFCRQKRVSKKIRHLDVVGYYGWERRTREKRREQAG